MQKKSHGGLENIHFQLFVKIRPGHIFLFTNASHPFPNDDKKPSGGKEEPEVLESRLELPTGDFPEDQNK